MLNDSRRGSLVMSGNPKRLKLGLTTVHVNYLYVSKNVHRPLNRLPVSQTTSVTNLHSALSHVK